MLERAPPSFDQGIREAHFVKGKDLGLKFRAVHGEDLGKDDRARTTADPADSSRSRNPEVLEQARVALLAHEVAHPVVIGPTAGGGKHGTWLLLPRRRATLADAESFAISRVLQLRARNSRISSFAAGQAPASRRATSHGNLRMSVPPASAAAEGDDGE